MKETSAFQSLNGIVQFAGTQPRTLLTTGWHHFRRVSAFVCEDGTRHRKAAVFVGSNLSFPDGAIYGDPRLEEHENRALDITDGDVYTAQCYRAHTLTDFAESVLRDAVGIEYFNIAHWALCRGAAYHTDAVFEELFALFHVAGTPGDLHFPRLGCKVYMTPGSWVIFDSAEPHGFTNDGAEVFDAKSNLRQGLSRFLSVGLTFNESAALAKAFGYQEEGKPRALRADCFEVDEFTGALSRIS